MTTQLPCLDPQRTTRHLLRKQHLAGGDDAPLLDVVEDLVGLHGTAATSPYLSLHARLERFSRADLDGALYERRSLVRLKAMRGTVFVFTHDLAPIAHAATRRLFVDADRRVTGLTADEYELLASAVLRALRGRSLSAAEIRGALRSESSLGAVIGILADEGRVVRDRPIGTWRSVTFRYRHWDETLPDVDLAAYAEDEAVRLLLLRYVAAYGPVTVADIAWWSGLGTRLVHRVLGNLGGRLTDVTLAGSAERYLMTVDDLARVDGEPLDGGRSVALLPALDPLSMGYRDRDRHLDPRHRDLVFDRGGNATSTVLVDGVMAGVWDVTDTPIPHVRVLLFDADNGASTSLLERAGRVGRFWFETSVPVVEYEAMVPLTVRSGVMRSPLDGATPRRTLRPTRRRSRR